ncbi:MAG TPA: proton extrusion protein PcxA [Allocoleopsis sp.]
MNLNSLFRTANRWFSDTPERALDQAYRAALMIKAIEDEHFNGKKISANSGEHSDSVVSYFEADLRKYLTIIRTRLAEFKITRSVLGDSDARRINNARVETPGNPAQYYPVAVSEKQSIIIEKLNFIDEVLLRYSEKEKIPRALVPLSQRRESQIIESDINDVIVNNSKSQPKSLQREPITQNGVITDVETVSDKTGVLPRSILRTFNRIQKELDPKAEEEVVRNFRNSKLKTIISLKFILTLIIVPILTHQIAKTFVVGPLVDRYYSPNKESERIFLNADMEEEAFVELKKFEEELRFTTLLGLAPKISPEDMEERVKEKAIEISKDYLGRSANAIKNVFSDILSLVAFGLVIFTSRQDIVILKSFMDDIVYGLSDSAKAFIIILFTDMFVGFHSPHGWEVILEGVSRHLGLPENRSFIFLFIATFPVILDSVIKYWIFRYLNRVSPSAVATYRNMNE